MGVQKRLKMCLQGYDTPYWYKSMYELERKDVLKQRKEIAKLSEENERLENDRDRLARLRSKYQSRAATRKHELTKLNEAYENMRCEKAKAETEKEELQQTVNELREEVEELKTKLEQEKKRSDTGKAFMDHVVNSLKRKNIDDLPFLGEPEEKILCADQN